MARVARVISLNKCWFVKSSKFLFCNYHYIFNIIKTKSPQEYLCPVVSENVIMVDLESCPNLDLGLDLVNGYLMKDHRNFMQWKEHKMKENVFARVLLTVLDYTIWIQFWDNHRRDKR